MLRFPLAGLFLVLVGCGVDVENRPIRDPPPGFGNAAPDAAAPDGGAGDGGGSVLAGNVCVAPTLGSVPGTSCNPSLINLSAATVRISGTALSTHPNAIGEFSLNAPAGMTSALVVVTPGSTGVVPAVLRADVPSAGLKLWTFDQASFDGFLTSTPVTWDTSTAIVFVFALDAMRRDVSGVTATSSAQFFWYDEVDRLTSLAPTGSAGLTAIVNAVGPQVSFDLVPPTDSRGLRTTHVDADAVPGYLTVKVVSLLHQ